jgi:hypothetical protein
MLYYGMKFFRRWAITVALILVLCRSTSAADPAVTRFPIGMAYAATAINVAVFRSSAVLSAGQYQFVVYYDPDAHIVVGRRDLHYTPWELVTLPITGNLHDAHNVVVLGISSDGLLHLSFDQHGQPLHYRISAKPYDIHSFGPDRPMTGRTENRVTYPQFVTAPDGTLYFFYRDGASGNGSLCLNRYDAKTGTWQAIHHPLIDGLNRCNPYWWRPAIAADGAINLAWCWRDTPNASTNHDICYATSKDGGQTWLRSDGQPQVLPITPENAEVIEPVAQGSNLINQCSAAVDADGHPHLAQYLNDTTGMPQYFHLWFDGRQWHNDQVSHRTLKFSLAGSGSLAIPISRPEIAIGKSGVVTLITRDAEFGGGIRLYRADAPYEKWNSVDLTHEDLGNWEPSYDINRLRQSGLLDLFVLPVRQGNHETTTNFPPSEAAIVETSLR